MFHCSSTTIHAVSGLPCCSSFEPLSFSQNLRSYPDYFFLFLSHLHRTLRMCLRAMTRAIEYPTFVCALLCPSLVLPSYGSTLQPLDQPSSHPLSLSVREQTWTQKKYPWMSDTYGYYGVSLLLASTLSLSARPRSESWTVIMEIETPFERCIRSSLFSPFFRLPRSRFHSRLLIRGRVIMWTDKIARRVMRKTFFQQRQF